MKIQPTTQVMKFSSENNLRPFNENNSLNNVDMKKTSVNENQNPLIGINNSLKRTNRLVTAAILLGVVGLVLKMPGVSGKVTKRINDATIHLESFHSLKDNKNIPILDECKSLDKTLRTTLENQIVHLNASKDIISEAGASTPPNRLLLTGAPGVGKSYFAKVFAKTIDAEYKEIRYSDFSAKMIGEHLENLKLEMDSVMKEAAFHPEQKYVLTINEIDAIIVPLENIRLSNYKKEERSIFINYLDEFKEKVPNLIIIGTTNAPAKNIHLDGAALSRFGNIIDIPFPQKELIYEAMKTNLKSIKNSEILIKNNDAELKQLAEKLANREASFRNVITIIDTAKNMHLNEKYKNPNAEFKFEYLKEAEKNFKHTDGEIYHNK